VPLTPRWARRASLALLLSTPALVADEDLARRAYAVLTNNCLVCHGALKTSGLDLRTREGMLAGGQRGSAVIPSNPGGSLILKFASHQEAPTMPPGKKLADEDLEILREWVLAGASLEGALPKAAPTGEQAKADLAKLEARPITAEERKFWSFQPPRRVDPPRVADRAWNANAIDAFLRQAMADRGLEPSPPADRRTLIRRAYLDLLGLPPSPEEVEAFVKDAAAGAWERLVDRLLASPHYGERWARHWLDVVRYADSGGFEFDVDRPDGWRYRDYVVRAFNDDKPYDRFIREQLAGDEYAPDSPDAMMATGFLRLGPEGGGAGELGRQEALDDLLSTTSLTFLGLTVGCARCHNHKFDPIPQKDYYRMQSAFFSTRPVSYALADAAAVAAHRAATQKVDELQKPLREARSKLEAPYLKRLVDEAVARLPEYMQTAWRAPEGQRTEGQRLTVRQIERTLKTGELSMKLTDAHVLALMSEQDKSQRGELVAQIRELDKQRPPAYATARAIGEFGREARPSYFLHRGNLDSRGSLMTPGVLSVVAAADYAFPAPPADAKSSWRRRGLAEWIASPDNPLTARVMVNRIWQHHFGEGIVRTPSNFGALGDRPSHPELLDWLATEFIAPPGREAGGWRLKRLHRLMMTSRAYQMSSNDVPANLAADPENRLFWRMPRQRLEAEVIRDAILAAAGTLDPTAGGPCVFPYINPDLFQSSTKRTWPGKSDDDPSTWRRSLYVFSKRSIRYPLFETFDQPNLVNSCDRRNRSTIAPQALLLMNNNFVLVQARMFAERVKKEAGAGFEAQIDRAWRLTLGRAPLDSERRRAAQYLAESPEGLAGLAHALFNLNEFVYRQ